MAKTLALLLALTTAIALVLAAPVANNSDKNQTDVASTCLNVSSGISTTSSITIAWSPNAMAVCAAGNTNIHFRVTALSLATGVSLTSPVLNSNESEYTMPDLAVDSRYEVCVEIEPGSTPTAGKDQPSGKTEKECLRLSTIQLVRTDSVVVLLVTLAVVILLIVSAYVCWRCAQKIEDSPATAEPGSEDENGDDREALLTPESDGNDKAANNKSPLQSSTLELDPPNNVQAGNDVSTHDDVHK